MKIKLSNKLQQAATALLVVMVLGGILCLGVMYYLSLIQQQNTLSVRSQAWNMAIAISEAGVEDGLQALNSTGAPSSADGWSQDGTHYWRTNTLPDGSWYTVTMDLGNPSVPAITSRANVRLPAMAAAPSLSMFAAVGADGTASTFVSRAIRVTCSKNSSSLYTAAMVSKHVIDLKGNGVLTDSYDSSDPTKSTNGKYDPTKYTGDYGDVATDDSVIVGVQQANIYGRLHTGPTGSFDIGTQGGVGTHAWQSVNDGMQPGYFLQDANFTFPDTTLPDTSTYEEPQPLDVTFPTNSVIPTFHTLNGALWWLLPRPSPPGLVTNLDKKDNITGYSWTTYTTNTYYVTNRLYDNVLEANHNYVTSRLNGTTIVQGPNVKLVLPNGLTGSEKLFFNYTNNINPGVTVYCGGTSASISGNQYVNPSGFAGSLIVYCAPTVTSFVLNGNGQFTGVLVAPNADLKMNGGGSSDQDFSGSLMVNNVRLNGHFEFHWDEALGHMESDNGARYLVKSWNEIP
jgi:hypothetical protein